MILFKKACSIGFLVGLASGTLHAAGILNLADFVSSRECPSLMLGEMRFERIYDLGRGRMMPVVVEITSKGNGMMRVFDAEFPVYDVHDNGDLFRGGMLDVELVDVDDDGLRDLVVSGIVDATDEKGGTVVASKVLVVIFCYDSTKHGLKLRFFAGPDNLREWFRDHTDKVGS